MSKCISAGDASYLNLLRLFYSKTPEEIQTPDGGGDEGTDTPKPEDKPLFTDEQQAEVNRIVSERTSRARQESNKMKAELERLQKIESDRQAELESQREKELIEQNKYQELIQEKDKKYQIDTSSLKARITQLDRENIQLRTDHAITDAVKGVKGVNPKLIHVAIRELSEGVVLPESRSFLKIVAEKTDEGFEIYPAGKDGGRITNGQGEYMTIDQAADMYYKSFPEYLLHTGRSGAGSTPQNGTTGNTNYEAVVQTARETGRNSDIAKMFKAKREQAERQRT